MLFQNNICTNSELNGYWEPLGPWFDSFLIDGRVNDASTFLELWVSVFVAFECRGGKKKHVLHYCLPTKFSKLCNLHSHM